VAFKCYSAGLATTPGAKLFYVSPFVEMGCAITSASRRPGRRRPLTTSLLLRAFAALPLVTLKIVAAIHCQALRLWLKDTRLAPRPHAAAAKDPNTSLASGKSRAYI